MPSSQSQITIYEAPDGSAQIEVRLERDTLWLSLLQLAELFDRDKSVISRHLKNIFDSGELSQQATVAKNATVQSEGGRATQLLAAPSNKTAQSTFCTYL